VGRLVFTIKADVRKDGKMKKLIFKLTWCKHCGELFEKETKSQKVCPNCKVESERKRKYCDWNIRVSKLAELRRLEDVSEDKGNIRRVQKSEKKIKI